VCVALATLSLASCGRTTTGTLTESPDGQSAFGDLTRTVERPIRIPSTSSSPGSGPQEGFGFQEGDTLDSTVVIVEYNGGIATIFNPWIVGFYYTELPILLDPTTDIFTPVLTEITNDYADTVHFMGKVGYAIGYFEYTYEDNQGNPLPDPDFEVAYQVLEAQGSQIELLPGAYIVPPSEANEQVDTTYADPETGTRAVYFLLPSTIENSPDIVGDSERKLLATVGFAGELIVGPDNVTGGFIDIDSAYFQGLEDDANHMVPLKKKSDGTYYQVGEEPDRNDPGTVEWVTPAEAEAILGVGVEPIVEFPTGQMYYDAYLQGPEHWDIDPQDLEGIDLNQPYFLILEQVIENRFQRELGDVPPMTDGGFRQASSWFSNWLKKFFRRLRGGGNGGGNPPPSYPYGGNSMDPVGPTDFSNINKPFWRGDILTAKYYAHLGNPLTWVPSWWWPHGWHHTGVIVTDTYWYEWDRAETIEAVNYREGVKRLPYPRVWVYNKHLKAIRTAYDKKLWIDVPAIHRQAVIQDLVSFWNNRVGNPYSIAVNKYKWSPNYCSQLAFVGYWDGAWDDYPYFYDIIDGTPYDYWVTPADILADDGIKVWWWWG